MSDPVQEHDREDLPQLPGRLQEVIDFIVEEAKTDDWHTGLDVPLELSMRHLYLLAFALVRELGQGHVEIVDKVDAIGLAVRTAYETEFLQVARQIGELRQRLDTRDGSRGVGIISRITNWMRRS